MSIPTFTGLNHLAASLDGELYHDSLHRSLYATDASVYRAIPEAVAIPKTVADLQKLIAYAREKGSSLIPRTAGTSLAGQCVGDGIVVDISRHFGRIIEYNKVEGWVRVEPGVVRDVLNDYLRPYGVFFSPITSTANRAMIGGMVGNNSSGTTSIAYGVTRDKVLEMKVLLADGNEILFGDLTPVEFETKCEADTLEGQVYRQIRDMLRDAAVRADIVAQFPKASIHRRNTGYALDALLDNTVFGEGEVPFNFCKLLCGSEGTLALTTEVKLRVDPLPPPVPIVVTVHCESVGESMRATQFAMQYQPSACELMDKIVLDCTKESMMYRKHRFFLEGDPAAVLMVEFRGNDQTEAQAKGEQLVEGLKKAGLGYAYPIISPERVQDVWSLRAAGLGLLANIPGDTKAVACIEDTAVALSDLPDYIEAFSELMKGFGQEPVYYAHAGAGELHLRPILDLKKAEDQQRFYDISESVAKLVKEYQGSLSGEHGDGRVRAPFIPLMVGEANYKRFRAIKHTWDPENIFNPGKIVDAPPMNTSLRYEANQETRQFETVFNFDEVGGVLRLAEKCNGSGDCRKLSLSGGTMCPSYRATRNEKDTTRARANILREFLTRSEQANAFNHEEIKEAMDLCLSCKGCTSECPSNVDVATLKAEFLHQYYQSNGVPLRAKVFANIATLNRWGSLWPAGYNLLLTMPLFSGLMKRVLGVAPARSLPTLQQQTLKQWLTRTFRTQRKNHIRTVYLFCDEFTNYNDTAIGIKAVELLDRLGYEVKWVAHPESGRAAISKGLLPNAKQLAEQQIHIFKDIISEDVPLVGIEPSAILSFRDEYPRLVSKELMADARVLASNCLLIDELLSRDIQAGLINNSAFTQAKRQILLHGHCHQKALGSIEDTVWALSLPENYSVEVIPSGCCGMAGSFGYEAEHYELSQQVGEEVLFPAVRAAAHDTLIVAPGTSCRHQLADGVGRQAQHPVEILWEAMH